MDSVKKTVKFQGITVKIDRPKGTVQTGKDSKGKPWRREYLYDYGFLPKTDGGDGEGVDVFLGNDPHAHTAFWVVQKKEDGSFDEFKAFLGFKKKSEAVKAYKQHIPEKFMGSVLALPVAMISSMLGRAPVLTKVAAGAFLDEMNTCLESTHGNY